MGGVTAEKALSSVRRSRMMYLFIRLIPILAIFEMSRNIATMRHFSSISDAYKTMSEGMPLTKKANTTTTVAYAVSITGFTFKDQAASAHSKLIDRAAVLHHSIKMAMQKSPRYDYHIYAFVHPDATEAIPLLELLGYRVQIRETPFNISEVKNEDLVDAQRIGCCGEKEYLKLYSYVLFDYPVVVHLDLDCLVLRSMDEVFDYMTLPRTADQIESFAEKSTMWMNKTFNTSMTHAYRKILDDPKQINFMFTRDYFMVDPPGNIPYNIGVQGGFLVVRPNQRDFDRMVDLIVTGGGFAYSYWGGEDDLKYGGFYGAGTIQGLASYYYDYHENATRSIELNKCKYNTMVDDPIFTDEKTQKKYCRTEEDECEDCRDTKFEDVYTVHFTLCGKPEYCSEHIDVPLCEKLMQEWHRHRLMLELDWTKRFSQYSPALTDGLGLTDALGGGMRSEKMGHCDGDRYIPLALPTDANSNDIDVLM